MSDLLTHIKLWFKEYFSTCKPINKKYLENDQLFLIAGHRGSPTTEIENTIASYERAIKDGANSLEIDLCLTKDNHVVVWHDWNPNTPKALIRESGFEPWVAYKPHPPAIMSPFRRKISELTIKEFMENFDYKKRDGEPHPAKAHKPTLEEFMKWSVNQKKLKAVFFDIKTPPDESDLGPVILEQLNDLFIKYNPEFEPVIETFHPEVLIKMKNKFPDFCYSLDEEPDFGLILDPRKHSSVKSAIKYKNHFAIAFRPRKVTIANWTTYRRIVRYDVKLRYKHNLKNPETRITRLIGGTVNKKKELICLVKLGISGIQTDFPHRLKEIALKYGKIVE